MSQLLQGLAGPDGRIPALDDIGIPGNVAYGKGGIPFEPNGKVAVLLNGPINHHHQGLPFTVGGKLVVEQGVFSYFGAGGAPFTSGGRLLVTTTTPTQFLGGVGFASSGAVCFDLTVV
jgi:hypothetical protein